MIAKTYLEEAHLKGFEKYKYNSIDLSPLSVKIMHPFWNKCVQYFPKWMAPNVITFTGFLLTVLNFFLIAIYDYGFTAADEIPNPIPDWIWIVAAINIFTAYNLDGIDGKQARRTGTSGPLGELFDHGLDSYSTVLISIYMLSLFGKNDLSPMRMFFVTLYMVFNFYVTHFEKYNTGIMFLPLGYDVLMWGISLIMAFTGLLGPTMWKSEFNGIKICHYFEIFLYMSGLLTNYPIVAWNIYKSYRDKTGKMRTFMEASRPLFPISGMFFVSSIWVIYSINDIVDMEPRLYFVMCGTLFSNICCRLIVAQMSDTRMDGWNNLLNLLVIATVISIFPFYETLGMPNVSPTLEKYILYALSFVATVAHLHYAISVVREMCNHFGIRCFKIPPRKPTTNGDIETGQVLVQPRIEEANFKDGNDDKLLLQGTDAAS